MRMRRRTCVFGLILMMCAAASAEAGTIQVARGGDLQAALNGAKAGDTILLEAGAEFVGNYVLPVKSGSAPIVVRSATPDALLPAAGQRITPAHAPLLARLRSPNTAAALRTAAGAGRWHLQYLELAWNADGHGDIMRIGDGSAAQNTLSMVPSDFVLSHLYVHGHPDVGQKRCISLNAAQVVIRDSHISDCKGVGMDTQAIGGWNGPGPYLIENNYLEAAGEVILFGGTDPAIPDLVASDIIVRRNLMSRPMAWRAPILATPSDVAASLEGGGTLAAGTYSYRIVARGPVGQGTTGRSTASPEVTVGVQLGDAVRLRWQAVSGATEYRVYRLTDGQSVYFRVTAAEFVDAGGAGTAEAVPTSEGTVWSVKNIFELKNARRVLVEHNILENHWKQAQPGWAIVLTPRNSGNACTWCVVEDLTFQYNLVRHVAAGINILGYDNTAPSGQAARLAFRHNVFHDVTTALGGNGWFMQLGDEPRDIEIDHNTIDHNGSTIVSVYGGTATAPRQVLGFRYTNNAARHGSYGLGGAHFAYGNAIITNYYPGSEITANYLAGGSASRYPAGNYFAGTFPDQFVSTASKDYTVKSGSLLAGWSATDGGRIGADFQALTAALAGVETGHTPSGNASPSADFTSSCTGLTCSFTDRSTDPDGAIAGWSWSFGDGTSSSVSNPSMTYAAAGTYTVTLAVTDTGGATASTSRSVSVTAPNAPPSASFTFACAGLTCAFTDTSTDADGTVTSWAWTFANAGTSAQRNPSFTFAAGGSYPVTLAATDNSGASASMTRTVTVAAVNQAPAAAFTWVCADLTCTFTDTSTDTDGTVTSWSWAFGNGATSSLRHPTHAFATAGTYTVVLAVSDNGGATASTSRSVSAVMQVHVGDLSRGTTKAKNTWDARVTVTVHQGGEQALAGAVVSYAWSGGATGSGTCTTDTTGTCPASVTALANKLASVTFTVTAISATGRTYLATANHDPDGNSNGTAITVPRP